MRIIHKILQYLTIQTHLSFTRSFICLPKNYHTIHARKGLAGYRQQVAVSLRPTHYYYRGGKRGTRKGCATHNQPDELFLYPSLRIKNGLEDFFLFHHYQLMHASSDGEKVEIGFKKITLSLPVELFFYKFNCLDFFLECA